MTEETLTNPVDATAGAVMEIVDFQLNNGVDPAEFIQAAKGTEVMLRKRGALVRRFLTCDEDGLWSDVIEWTSREQAMEAAAAVMQEPEFAPFMAMIDPESARMRHAAILWRME